MRLNAARLVAEAMRLLRRDAAVLLAVAGPFWFAPTFALLLFVPAPPAPPAAGATQAWAQAYAAWLAAQAPWYVAAWLVGLFGAATVYALYLAPGRPDVRRALALGARAWPRLALASALGLMAAGAAVVATGAVLGAISPGAVVIAALPALYILGRLLPLGPLLIERPGAAIGAVGRSWALTRGAGWPLMSVVAATIGLGLLLGQPVLLLEGVLRGQGGGGNPVAIAIVDAAAAAVSAGAALASALLAVVAYRGLAR